MSTRNPLALKRPALVQETKTFTDALQPGFEFSVTFRVDSQYGGALENVERAQRHIENYVTGRNGGPPAPLPPIGGRPVKLTRSLCTIIASFEEMEVAPPGEEKLDFFQWVGLAVNCPNIFQDLVEWANELRAQADTTAKN